VTTTFPNLFRASVIPMGLFFQRMAAGSDARQSAAWLGAGVMVIATISLWALRETYGKSLDFVES
jgi:hypothetical protein